MPQNPNIILTDKAGKQIANIIQGKNSQHPENAVLRIAVVGGGCSGFQYTFDVTALITDQDLILENQNGRVAIDPVSCMYLENSEIDFVDDIIGQSFKINNPNAIASCGCGTSFAV